jgi:serine/threonine protein kinase/ActR/RegA family two-component response regulator
VRILVAEDDDALRRALTAILKRWGHEVVGARDGKEALDIVLGPEPIDIALLDWEMPVQSGVDVCQVLRARAELPYIYVILLTGRDGRDDRIHGIDAGADDYLVKPFDPRELEVRLKTAARILGLQRPRTAPNELPNGRPTTRPSSPPEVAYGDTLLVGSGSSPRPTPVPDIASSDPLVGRALGGKYQIRALVGRGASGMVYRAFQIELGRTVAIKVLNPLLQWHPEFVARFQREAVATSMLDHANVLRVIDFGREEDGVAYLVMEYLDGRNLDEVLEEFGTLPQGRAVEIVAQICAGLGEAHGRGIVHRDIKPENVMMTRGRNEGGAPVDLIKICDFGIARMELGAEDSAASCDKLTAAGTIWGTPRYMSPEQARGATVDGRSDLYACGILLYEMVTGHLPFQGKSPLAVLQKHLHEAPTRPSELQPDIDPRLEAIILKAMEKDPAERFQSARELRAALCDLLASWSDTCLPPLAVRSSRPARGAEDVATLCGAA